MSGAAPGMRGRTSVILDATLLLLSGPTDVHYSRSVAQHAIESGRPVEAIDDRIADAGSTLCVPFVVRDAPGGCHLTRP